MRHGTGPEDVARVGAASVRERRGTPSRYPPDGGWKTVGVSWIDISTPLRDAMPVYPGDPPVRISLCLRMADGAPADVTELAMPAHIGTHVDAPAHVIPGAPGVESLPVDALIGRARVVAAPAGTAAIGADMVRDWALAPRDVRLLVRTSGGEAGFTPDAAGALVRHGVRLIGIDTMSIAAPGDPVPTHRALLHAGVVILEGLRLDATPPGAYDLVCLPLLIPGADGAPARALLRPGAP